MISNHGDLQRMVGWHDIPNHVPVTPENKPEAFAKVEQLVDDCAADVVVLARYMQIIPAILLLCNRVHHFAFICRREDTISICAGPMIQF